MVGLLQDLKLGGRLFLRSPGLTIVVVVTLALGIGATTAIFSFVSGVLLEPLDYPNPEQLVVICETHPSRPADWCGASPANWDDWSRSARLLENLGLARGWRFGVRYDEALLGVSGGLATPGVFQTFRVRPQLGRLIQQQDIVPGNQHVTLVSHRFWQSSLSSENEVIGKGIWVDGIRHEIIGVLPESFALPDLEFVEMWIPLWPERFSYRGWRGLSSFARLREGVSLEAAQEEMRAIREQLAEEYPDDNRDWGIVVESLHERTVRSVRTALLAFAIAVFLVLLIACANTANLFLSRSASRESEFGVRLALGVGRIRLFRQVIAESSLYALTGNLMGILLAMLAVDVFVKLAPVWFPRIEEVQLNQEVLLFSLGVGTLTTLLFGAAPAMQAMRINLHDVVRTGQRSQRCQGARLRRLLVVGEIALACLLAVGAGLFTRSFSNLLDWKPGFDPANLNFASVFVSTEKFSSGTQIANLFQEVVQQLKQLPGVVSAAGGSAIPLLGGDGEQEFRIEGRPPAGDGTRPVAAWLDVTPEYFETLRIPLLKGRNFSRGDRDESVPVAIVNQTMARQHWPSQSPIGERVFMTAHQMTLEIVGVVGDVQPFRPDQAPVAQIYWPFAQHPRAAIMLLTRASISPDALVTSFRTALEELDPDLDIGPIRSMDELVEDQLVSPAFNTSLADLFAGIAVVIALIGVYGMISFMVEEQYSEFGVRMALGARNLDISLMVLKNAARLCATGLAVGFAVAWSSSRLLQSLLIGVEPTDPATFLVIGGGLALAAMLASFLPARKAARVDPLTLLRCQ